jgi:N6-L-threonylcarbamoyladenine synthase
MQENPLQYTEKRPIILAIESSCDETAAAVYDGQSILSNIITGQQVHEIYGGVVPELAGRAHLQQIVPVVKTALIQAFRETEIATVPELLEHIDAIAFTQSPGLIGSLLVGAQFAKSMALATQKPLIAIHHMQAHVLANLLCDPAPTFPFLCLTVSGGHTQIVLAHHPLKLEVLGETIDDAAGEAFDKTAKMLGLPYPGGPLVDKYAAMGRADAFRFAEPKVQGLHFSFSGLKTSVLYFLRDEEVKKPSFKDQHLADICASVQATIIRILLKKLSKAVSQTGIRNVCLAGGVSANSGLRKAFIDWGKNQNCRCFIPAFEYCTDNAAMIAVTGYHKYLAGHFSSMDTTASARIEWKS